MANIFNRNPSGALTGINLEGLKEFMNQPAPLTGIGGVSNTPTDNSKIGNNATLQGVLGNVQIPQQPINPNFTGAPPQLTNVAPAPTPTVVSRPASFRNATKAPGAPPAVATPAILGTPFNAGEGSRIMENGIDTIRGLPGHVAIAPTATPKGLFGGYNSPEAINTQRQLASELQSALMHMNPEKRFGTSMSPSGLGYSSGSGIKALPTLLAGIEKMYGGQAAQSGTEAQLGVTASHDTDLAQQAQSKIGLEKQELPSKIALNQAHGTYFREMAKAANTKADKAGAGAGGALDRIAAKAEAADELAKMKAGLSSDAKIENYLMTQGFPFDPMSVTKFKQGQEFTQPAEGKKHWFKANVPESLGGWAPKGSIVVGTDPKGNPIFAAKPKK